LKETTIKIKPNLSEEYIFAIIISLVASLFSLYIVEYTKFPTISILIYSIIFILFGILYFIDFQLQFIFFVVCTPIIILLKGGGYNPFHLSEIFVYFLMLLLLFQSFLLSKEKLLKKQKYLLPLTLFIVWSFLLSLFHATNLTAGLASFITHNKYILLVVITPLLLTSIKKIKLLLIPIIITGFFVTISSLYLFITGKGYGTLFGLGNIYRIKGIFPNENMLGVYIAFVLIAFVGYRLNNKKNMSNVAFDLAIIIPMILLLILTYSRRAWIAFIIGLFILGINKKNILIKKIIILLFVVVFLSIFIVDFNSVTMRINTVFSLTYLSNLSRSMSYTIILKNIFSNFSNLFLGLGVGSIGPASIYYNLQENYLDSYYLLIFAEFGLIGLFFYFWLLFSTLKYLWPKKNSDKSKEKVLIITCIASSILVIICGFIGNTNISFPINFYLWLFLGVGIVLKNTEKQKYSSVKD